MAKQTFTTGQVLTAAQMTSLQETAMGGGPATAKTASYTLVAADAGTVVRMNSAGATTITVNTSLFAAGDTVYIQNIGAGVCTITAGTATVNTASSLALAQYEGGTLYFTAASASLFFKADGAAAGGGGKVLQVVNAVITTTTAITSTSMTDSSITLAITPTLATSKVLVMISAVTEVTGNSDNVLSGAQLLRGATQIADYGATNRTEWQALGTTGTSTTTLRNLNSVVYLDSPATTSSTTYKLQAGLSSTTNGRTVTFQRNGHPSTITLLEIGA